MFPVPPPLPLRERHRTQGAAIDSSIFLVIGSVGLVLLVVSAFLAGDHDVDSDADFDMDTDFDIDTDFDMDTDFDVDADFDADTDFDVDTHLDAGHGEAGHGGGGVSILQWFSLKALSVAAVGFGFMGWAMASNDSSAAGVWFVAIVTGLAVWALAVLFLFPWLRRQQGHDLQPASAYQGLTADVVVRIPANGIGTVQFRDPSGAVVRRTARSVHRDHEVPIGTRVVIVLAAPEHLAVDEFSIIEDPT